jgi:hypothetical protein
LGRRSDSILKFGFGHLQWCLMAREPLLFKTIALFSRKTPVFACFIGGNRAGARSEQGFREVSDCCRRMQKMSC